MYIVVGCFRGGSRVLHVLSATSMQFFLVLFFRIWDILSIYHTICQLGIDIKLGVRVRLRVLLVRISINRHGWICSMGIHLWIKLHGIVRIKSMR